MNRFEKVLPMDEVKRVKYRHVRVGGMVPGSYCEHDTIGSTWCTIELKDGAEIGGTANCSVKDQFNKSIGRQISYGRACKSWYSKLYHTQDKPMRTVTKYKIAEEDN